eukprot:CAMPEP_0179918306 /NCGR_PEP_ID=MMETSP0983-20121128/3324_1 /TAXON_ID=483367 /ORGANISM="non described non described, Strain CCMP 2436" /LENGTH=43 /DNA_ID= /DNA_START= /DNA_END= /DNA_ORIENTATION=
MRVRARVERRPPERSPPAAPTLVCAWAASGSLCVQQLAGRGRV